MIAVLWSIHRRDIRRCAGALLLVALAGVALGLLYPVQRELDRAAYDRADFETQAEIMVGPADLSRVQADLGADTFVTALWNSPLVKDGREVNILLMATGTPGAAASSPFSPSTRTAGPAPVEGTAWIDLDAGLANHLGVRPGDEVVLPTGPTGPRLTLTVRSVNAIRLPIAEYTAMAPADVVFAATPGVGEEQFFQAWVPRLGTEEVRRVLATPFYKERLVAAKLDPPVVSSRTQLLRDASDVSTSSLGLVRVTAVVAALGALAFTLREVDVLRRRSEPNLALLTRLGVPAGGGAGRLWGLAAVATTAALLTGSWLGALALDGGPLAPVLPPALRVVVAGAVLGVVGVTLAFLAAGLWRAARRVKCG